MLITTNQNNRVVLLFAQPAGAHRPPKLIRLKGKSTEQDLTVLKKDMPNFYVEALTIHDGRVYTEMREVIVPPEKRVLNVEVLPSQKEYKPGAKATVKVKVTDFFGKPFVGALVLSMYDRSVEYISGGSNVPEIREFFWKWRRHHYPHTEASVGQWFQNLLRHTETGMSNLGVFGETVVEELQKGEKRKGEGERGAAKDRGFADSQGLSTAAAPVGFGGRGESLRRGLKSDKKADAKP